VNFATRSIPWALQTSENLGLAAGMEIDELIGNRPSDPQVETDCTPRLIKLLPE